MFDPANSTAIRSLNNKKLDSRRTKKANYNDAKESPAPGTSTLPSHRADVNDALENTRDFADINNQDSYRTSKRLSSLKKIPIKKLPPFKDQVPSINNEKKVPLARDESMMENSKSKLNIYNSLTIKQQYSQRNISRDKGLLLQSLAQQGDMKAELLSPASKVTPVITFPDKLQRPLHSIVEGYNAHDRLSIKNTTPLYKSHMKKVDFKLGISNLADFNRDKGLGQNAGKLSKLISLPKWSKLDSDSKVSTGKAQVNKMVSKYKLKEDMKKSNSQFKMCKPDKGKDQSNEKIKSSANLLKNSNFNEEEMIPRKNTLGKSKLEISMSYNQNDDNSNMVRPLYRAMGENISKLLLSKKRHSHAVKIINHKFDFAQNSESDIKRNYIKSQDSRRDRSHEHQDYRSVDRKNIELMSGKSSLLLAKFLANSKLHQKVEKFTSPSESSIQDKNQLSKSSIQDKKLKFLLPESEYNLANKKLGHALSGDSKAERSFQNEKNQKHIASISRYNTLNLKTEVPINSSSNDFINYSPRVVADKREDVPAESHFEAIVEQSEDMSSKKQSLEKSVSQKRFQKLFNRKPKNSLSNDPKINLSSNLCSSRPLQIKIATDIKRPMFPMSTSHKHAPELSFGESPENQNLAKNSSLNDLASKGTNSVQGDQLKTSSKLSAQAKPYDRLKKTLLNRKEVKRLMRNIHAFFDEFEKGDAEEIPHFFSSPEYYKIERQIGKGCFGSVYLAIQIITNLPVALKVIQKSSLKSHKAVDRIQREIDILKILSKEKYISKIFEVFEDDDQIYIVCEYQPNGDLVSFFKQSYLPGEDELRRFFFKIAKSVKSMHQFAIIHRDIKMDNILLDKNFDPMLNDFGISSVYDPLLPIKDTGGTPAYLAPEVILAKGEVCFKSDVWGLGVLLYVLAFGFVPFQGEDIQSLYRCILKGKFNFPEYNFVSPELKDLICNMIRVDLDSRFSIDEVLNHKWFLGAVSNQSNDLTEIKTSKKTERVRKEAVVRYLNDVGFSLDFIYMSTNNYLFNHAFACFENLMRNANF
jgi:hypothetical protein